MDLDDAIQRALLQAVAAGDDDDDLDSSDDEGNDVTAQPSASRGPRAAGVQQREHCASVGLCNLLYWPARQTTCGGLAQAEMLPQCRQSLLIPPCACALQ